MISIHVVKGNVLLGIVSLIGNIMFASKKTDIRLQLMPGLLAFGIALYKDEKNRAIAGPAWQ